MYVETQKVSDVNGSHVALENQGIIQAIEKA